MMTTMTPDSDRTPAPTLGQELEREAKTLGSALQFFLRLRWWIVAVSAIGVFAWKGNVTPPAAAATSTTSVLEHKVDAIDRNVNTLIKLACLQYGPTSVEIAISDIDCSKAPVPAPGDRTTTPRIRR